MNRKTRAKEAQKRILGYFWERQRELGLSTYALAKKSEISESMLSRIKSGQREPSLVTLLMLAGALDIRPYFVPKDADSDNDDKFHYYSLQ